MLSDVILAAIALDQPLGLLEAISEAHRRHDQSDVSVETVFTDGRPPLRGLAPDASNVSLYGASGRQIMVSGDPESSWFAASWPTRHAGVFHIVTNLHSTDSTWKKVERWINRSREVTRVFLDHTDFLTIAANLSEYGDVEVGRVSSRSAIDGSSANRGWGAASARMRPDPRAVVGELMDQGQSVRTMTLHVSDVLSVHLRRTAGATFYSGEFSVFADSVLGPLADAAASRRQLLTGRARQSGLKVRPVSVELGYRRFNSPQDTGDVIDAIAAMASTTIAVFHRNPYLHLTVADEVDGSNFDVLVTENDRIDIYPGFLASAAAFARLANQLADRFGAEDVQGRLDRAWALEDLMGE